MLWLPAGIAVDERITRSDQCSAATAQPGQRCKTQGTTHASTVSSDHLHRVDELARQGVQ